MDAIATVTVVVDRIARAAFAASGAYLVGSWAFRLLVELVRSDAGDIDRAA